MKILYKNEDLDNLTEQERLGLQELQQEMGGNDEQAYYADYDDNAALNPSQRQPYATQTQNSYAPVDDKYASTASSHGRGAAVPTDEIVVVEGDVAGVPQDQRAVARKLALSMQTRQEIVAQLEEVEKARKDLAQRYDEGEVTTNEMLERQNDLTRAQMQLEQALEALEEVRITETEIWEQQVLPAFFAKHPEYRPDTPAFDMLDMIVAKLQDAAEDPYDPALLERAHHYMQSLQQNGAVETAPNAPQAAVTRTAPVEAVVVEAVPVERAALAQDLQVAAPQAPERARRVNTPNASRGMPAMPPSLSHAPAADFNPTGDGGTFALLDRLADSDPLKFEAALARLSESERNAYLTGQ